MKTALLTLVIVVIILIAFVYGYGFFQKKVFLRKNLPAKTIALTFDDGPVLATEKILDMLKELHIPATFFVLGSEAEQHPDILKRIQAEGHMIGNHTYDHPYYLGLKSKEFILTQVEKTNNIIESIVGEKPKVFRSPFGHSSPYSDHLVRQLGMKPYLWTMSTVDWSPKTTADILDKKLTAVSRSEIILMHDRIYDNPTHLDVLRNNIIRLQKEGFQFVTLTELK